MTPTVVLFLSLSFDLCNLPFVSATATATNPQPVHVHLSPGVKAGIGLGVVATVILLVLCCCIGPRRWIRSRRQQGHDPAQNSCWFRSNDKNEAGIFEEKGGSESDIEGRVTSRQRRDQAIKAEEVKVPVSETKVNEVGGDAAVARETPVDTNGKEIPRGEGAAELAARTDPVLSAGSVVETEVQLGVPPPAYHP